MNDNSNDNDMRTPTSSSVTRGRPKKTFGAPKASYIKKQFKSAFSTPKMPIIKKVKSNSSTDHINKPMNVTMNSPVKATIGNYSYGINREKDLWKVGRPQWTNNIFMVGFKVKCFV